MSKLGLGLFLLISLQAVVIAQDLKLRDKEGKVIPGIEATRVETVETGRYFVPNPDPSKVVDLSNLPMIDASGNQVKLQVKDKVTLIEYWSTSALNENQYWNRMREMEQKYKDNPRVQVVSINYEPALNGKEQRKFVQDRLKSLTQPKWLLFDLMDGLGDLIQTPGPISYILVDGRGQYTYVGRGDDNSTDKVFESIDNAILYLDHNKDNNKPMIIKK